MGMNDGLREGAIRGTSKIDSGGTDLLKALYI
jgi:hypothetical protein